MAGYLSIAAAGESLQRLLNQSFREDEPVPGKPTRAVLVRTEDLQTQEDLVGITPPAVSLLLYRVELNKSTRAGWAGVGTRDGHMHLPLDLHFLLTPWADNANHECRILGRVMQCFEQTPILSGPLLDSVAGWEDHEAIQVYLEDLATEDLMRTFDSLPLDYKLSVGYLLRVVRMDAPSVVRHGRVATAVGGATPSAESQM